MKKINLKITSKKILLSLIIIIFLSSVIITSKIAINTNFEKINRIKNLDSKRIATINTNYGNITVELFNDLVPITTNHFEKLVKEGFYNGTIFHRIKNNTIVFAGEYDYDRNRLEYNYDKIDPEINNEIKHTRGIISFVLSSINPPKIANQFLICVSDLIELDGQNPAFGRVIDGMEVIDNIASLSHHNDYGDGSGQPLWAIVIKNISIKNIEK